MRNLIKKKLQNLISRLRSSNKIFSKYYTYLIFSKNALEKTIFVYTMGKVGSKTIANVLYEQLENYSIHHVHWINKDNIKTIQSIREKKTNTTDSKEPYVSANYSKGFFLNKRINEIRRKNQELKIFTLTREPVSQNISAFFQDFEYKYGGSFDESIKNEDDFLVNIKNIYLNDYIYNYRDLYTGRDALSWFDDELKHVSNIDVYSTQFPKEKGFKIYKEKNISVLLMRVEDLNEIFPLASKIFVGRELKLSKNKNVSDGKKYSHIYEKFKKDIILPSWFISKMYESKYANHFYTEEEIKKFKSKWNQSKK